MIQFSRKVLSELEEELQVLSFDYDNPIVMCEKSTQTTVKHLYVLKKFILDNGFETLENEILFFKTIKPKFTSKLIYFKKVRNLESRKPQGSKRIIRKYLDNELNKLNNYFSENMEFYNYYRTGSEFIDHKIFIRNNVEINYNLEYFYFELDHRFATSHDFKVAAILGNENFQKYIENKIANLSNRKPIEIKPQIELPTMKWTESKSAIIELIYALHTQKAFNNGKADIVDIAKHFEIMFEINLDDIYQVSNEIKNRKINKTKFLDLLKENLKKRFEE
ncbi:MULTISPECIES: RteC domain-containing protein [unclassified Flavobacterium]|uniref:RteC domain-containing protein n=1 Tax=unclassified Flavobacterium TaxID=196869 RepID=UPI0025B9F882|nr:MULTISPECIES: RteC domain-containing protein [unclassified Flavobacterium]